MKHADALELAKKLMYQHNLTNWGVSLNYNSALLGRCDYNKKRIEISTKALNWTDDKQVEETILHEIAHAVVGPGHAHDEVWTKKAEEFGISTDATKYIDKEELIKPDVKGTKLVYKCPTCGVSAIELSSFEYGDQRFTTLDPCKHIAVKKIVRARNLLEFKSRDGHSPYPFQAKSVEFIEGAGGRALIAHEMGLGKTIIDLLYARHHSEVLPKLVICKAGLSLQWFKAIYNWAGEVSQIIQQRETIFPGFKYYIISFDLLRNIDPERLKPLGIKSVTIDECQHIKNPEAQRTQEVRKLIKQFEVEHITALSGTPFKNRGSEYFTILNILHPEKFPTLQAFMNEFVDYYWNGYSYKEAGIRNLERFRERTHDFVLRYERAEVMPELPLVDRRLQYYAMSEQYQKAYDTQTDDFIKLFGDIEEGKGISNEVMTNLLAEIAKLRRITGLSKVPDCVEFVADFLESTERKITIFLHHHSVARQLINELNAYCDGAKIKRPLQLKSELNGEERSKIQDIFNTDDSYRILVASTLASGEGLNLQHKCSDTIILERQWNPANEEQAEARFIRIGQTAQSVGATYILAGNTIDEWLTDIVEQKRSNFTKSMSGLEEFICLKCNWIWTSREKSIECPKCKATTIVARKRQVEWSQTDIIRELTNKIISEGRKKWNIKTGRSTPKIAMPARRVK